MRLPILSFPPLAALLLAGWVFSPALSQGEQPAKPGHISSNPASGTGGRKGEKGKPAQASDGQTGKKHPPAVQHEGPSRSGTAPGEGSQGDTAAAERAQPPAPAAGGQNKPEHSGDDEENEEHADASEPAANSGGEGAGQTDKDDSGDSLAGLVPSRDQANRAKLNALLPPGSTHRGVYYPSFRPVRPDPGVTDPATGLPLGVDAPMDSLFRGEAVTRLDDNHVLIDEASYVQFDQSSPADAASPQKRTLSVDLQQALYDLKNDILVSHQPVRIENEQMILTGDSMVHDRVSGLTELTGSVHVILFGTGEAPPAATDPGSSGNAADLPKSELAAPSAEAPQKAVSDANASQGSGAAGAAASANPAASSKKPKPGNRTSTSRK